MESPAAGCPHLASRIEKAGQTEYLQTLAGVQAGIQRGEGRTFDRDQKVNRHCLRFDFPQGQQHIDNIVIGLALPDDTAAAYLHSSRLTAFDGIEPVLEGMGGTDFKIITAA